MTGGPCPHLRQAGIALKVLGTAENVGKPDLPHNVVELILAVFHAYQQRSPDIGTIRGPQSLCQSSHLQEGRESPRSQLTKH